MPFDPEATYREYRAEEAAKTAQAKAAAPKNCPYCGDPINQNSWNNTVQQHCGKPACRQKEYRKNGDAAFEGETDNDWARTRVADLPAGSGGIQRTT